ncbi:MAG: hypothetical protein E7354_05450 [Clostridiales bacterium]|nr:hypothetical protein [Clostridiales bacterium]
MPSGSRGGSRGGHGGSRGGGSRSSGGLSRSYSRSAGSHFSSGYGGYHGGSHRHHHGHTSHIFIHSSPGRHSIRLRHKEGRPDRYFDLTVLHSFIFVICTIIIMIASVNSCNAGSDIDIIREDYAYYQNMIAYAEMHPDDYIVDAKITSYGQITDCDKYYINYEIKYTERIWSPYLNRFIETTDDLEGYTFSVYDWEDIAAFREGQVIQVAVDTMMIGEYTDSIPMDFKYMTIEDDGEYIDSINQQTKSKKTLIVTITILVGWCIVFAVVSKKLEKKFDKQHPVNAAVEKPVKEGDKYCDYCGTYWGRNDIGKCPGCGASKR